MILSNTTPIIRILNEAEAKSFYLEYLGFKLDWEHRFEPGFPIYFQVTRDQCVLHLSEHSGDCKVGSAMRIKVQDIESFHKELTAKNSGEKVCLKVMPWGTREMNIIDPFGNKLKFCSEVSAG